MVVIGVRAYPEPSHCIPFHQPQGAPPSTNTNRVHRLLSMNTLELQAWMRRILSPELIILTGQGFDLVREHAETGNEIFRELGVPSSSMPIFLILPARTSARAFSTS